MSVCDAGNGIAAISVDGVPEQRVNHYGLPSYSGAPAQAIHVGEAVNYFIPRLRHGVHTVRVRVTAEIAVAYAAYASIAGPSLDARTQRRPRERRTGQ